MPRAASHGLLAVALAALVYANALDNPFVYDDRETVLANPSLVDPSNVRFVLVHSPFRPVVNVSYAIDRAIWGYRPFGFHLTNILLHAGVVALLYVLLLCALADLRGRAAPQAEPRVRPRPGGDAAARAAAERGDRWAAFAGALLFGVHPLMTEAVGYVSGRSELLCGLFFLAALLCARIGMLGERLTANVVVGRRHGTVSGLPFAALAVVFGVLALLSKEVAAALPIVVLAYDWLVVPSTASARRKRLAFAFVPLLVLLGAAAVYRLSMAAGPVSTEAPFLNLLTQSIVIWRYLGLLVLPVGQSIMHGVHRVTSPTDPLALVALAGLIGLGVLSWRLRRTAPLIAFGLVWFLAVIAPSSSVIALREGMAEHRAYLASAGVFATVCALAAAAARSPAQQSRRSPWYGVALAAIAGVLAALTLARNAVWGSEAALWKEATVHASGMWEPHYALGDALREAGDCGAAIPEYETVVRQRPQHRDAHTNLGICLAQTNRLEEAATAFERALDIDPQYVRGYTNLGAVALMSDQPERARDFYQRALHVDPQNVLARMQLARLLETVFNDYHGAARMCGEARAIAPATPGVADCVERNQKLAAAKDAGR